MARLFGRPAVTRETVGFAELIQARIRSDSKRKDGGSLLENFCVQHFSGSALELMTGDAQALFRNATDTATTHAAALTKVLATSTGAEVIAALAKAISGQDRGVGEAKATERARVIYTAFVAQAARYQDREARKTIETLSKALDAVLFLTEPQARYKEVTRIAEAVGSPAFGGSEADRIALGRKLADVRSSWANSDSPKPIIDAVIANITFATTPKDFEAKLAQLTAIETAFSLAKGMPQAHKAEVRAALTHAQGYIQAVQNREADLASLGKELVAIGADKAQRTHTRPLELAKALGQLDKASTYAAARQGLDHVVATMVGHSRAAVLERLCEHIAAKPESNPGVRDQTYALGLLAAGDPHMIDMVFNGPDWHEDAYQLKAAAITLGDEKALKNLDVQHNLRIVAGELDRAMQHASLDQPGRANFGRKPFSKALPRGVFSATQADPKLIGWFMRHAPGIVKDRDLVIANWIRLSCYDPATGTVDAARTKPLFEALRMEGFDPAHIEQSIQQGFANSAAVVRCREQVCTFARALDDAKLLTEMEAARSTRFRAETLSQKLLQAAIGIDPAGMSQADVASRMQASLKAAAPHATRNIDADLAGLMMRRNALVTQIENGAGKLKALGAAKLDVLKDPARLVQSCVLYQHALDALADDATAGNPNASDAAREAAEKGRDEHLAKLKFFNVLKLRENTGGIFSSRERGATATIQNLRLVKDELALLLELNKVESNIGVTRAKQIGTDQSDLFVRRAMQVAILQEAVASDSVDFTPKEKAGAIMKRMAAFGFVAGSNNQHMKDMVTAAAVSVTQNAKTLDALCTFYGAEADVRGIDPKSVMRSDVQAKRDKNAEVIRSQLGELGANKSFAIRYGAFGDVVVSLPVFVGVSVSGETRVQRDNAITISHEEVAGKARFTLKLVGGASVRQGVSVSAMADLLAVKGFVHRASDQGYSFSFDDRQACMDLALALANGDAADPRLWTGSRIQSEQSASKGMGGSVNASLDLGVIAFEAQAQIQGSREVAVQQSMFGRSETYGRHFEATATASATLAGEMGAKDVARGIDRTVSRTLQTQLGMFTKDSRAIVSAKVINGNVDHCLKYVLPPALAGQADAFKAQLDGIEDGTQVFVRCRLDPKVRESANKLLVQAEKTLLDASLFSGDDATRTRRRDAARKEAQELVVRAYAMTAKPEAYLPEGLGWTTKAQVEVTSSRKAFEYFASSEALETRFVPFDTPAGLLRADVEL